MIETAMVAVRGKTITVERGLTNLTDMTIHAANEGTDQRPTIRVCWVRSLHSQHLSPHRQGKNADMVLLLQGVGRIQPTLSAGAA